MVLPPVTIVIVQVEATLIEGTTRTISVLVTLCTVAAMPHIVAVTPEALVGKFVPVIVTTDPETPLVGVKPVIVGEPDPPPPPPPPPQVPLH
jgi:hypothetical protein